MMKTMQEDITMKAVHAEIDALPEEDQRELRRRIKAAWPIEDQIALLSGSERTMTKEEHTQLVRTQFELFKQDRAQKRQPVST